MEGATFGRANQIKKLDPKLAEKVMLKAGLKPLVPYPSSDKPWKCKCMVCGNIVKPPYKQIVRGIGGCKTCRYVKSGKSNSNSEVEAVALMLKNNFAKYDIGLLNQVNREKINFDT
jgi:hypothetical protein